MQAKTRRWLGRLWFWGVVAATATVAADYALREMRSSELQARYLSQLGKRLTYRLEPGKSALIRFPASGPYDQRLGYVELPTYIERLKSIGFEITAQARFSATLARVFDAGLYTAYEEKNRGGLRVTDRDGRVLFSASYPERIYPDFASIPPLVLNTLLYIENRELLDEYTRHKNPAIEWDRFARASLDVLAEKLGATVHVSGGSTLATQLEKYRHSPEGRTDTVIEKLRQMASASLRAYLRSPDTIETRRAIALAYLNTVPLAAAPRYGEVHGIGDGLWIWYGRDPARVTRLLSDAALHAAGAPSTEQAQAYRDALSLVLAQRRPAYYLGPGHDALQRLVDSHLRVLGRNGVISRALRDAALALRSSLRQKPIDTVRAAPPSKTETVLRARLARALGVPLLYDLDRTDLSVESTIDKRTQQAVTQALHRLGGPEHARAAGLYGFRLFGDQDELGRVTYSLMLFERSPTGNLLRVQSDNSREALDISEGIRLDLGSTAKFRTLVTYLEIIADLYGRYSGRPAAELGKLDLHRRDYLSRWAIDSLRANPRLTLPALLEAALERRFSASPGEAFFTGGGLHTFANFDKTDNRRIMSVREALRNSVNLVFIRLMREVVYHHLYRPGGVGLKAEAADSAWRRKYLERFADQEGQVFLRRFYAKYRGKDPQAILKQISQGIHPIPSRLSTVHRSLFPDHDVAQFATYLRGQATTRRLSDEDIAGLYDKYSTERFNLHDRGYIAHVHPLDLWLAAYLTGHPNAGLDEVVSASREERQAVYQWLFKPHRKRAQDKRIQGLLEIEAFAEVHSAWTRLGYPFQNFTASYACAIGASADRPAALAELVGIVLNGGVRYPQVRFQSLHFAAGTPYETLLERPATSGERVMAPEVAAAARSALIDVVERGTAQRLKGAYRGSNGSPLVIGGKTGTGDHRREVYGRGGRLIASRVVSRSATFVFFLGERFFGTITAYVAGPEAARYKFTSGLPVQVLKSLAPTLEPLLAHAQSDKERGLLTAEQ